MPTAFVEFGLIELLWALNLSQIRFFVLPMYCGFNLQLPDSFTHVIQYIKFEDKQFILERMGNFSFVVDDVTLFTNLGECLQRLQFLLQCLKPSFFLSDLRSFKTN